jgi:hypothetical protein
VDSEYLVQQLLNSATSYSDAMYSSIESGVISYSRGEFSEVPLTIRDIIYQKSCDYSIESEYRFSIILKDFALPVDDSKYFHLDVKDLKYEIVSC